MLQLSPVVEVGDLLTSATVLLSAIALVVAWRKDRLSAEREQADKIRSAAAIALTKLDRWRAVRLAIYDELEPALIETGEIFDRDKNVGDARGSLLKTIHLRHAAASVRVLDEHIETAYFELLSHFPSARLEMLSVFDNMKRHELDARQALLRSVDDRLATLLKEKSDYEDSTFSAELSVVVQQSQVEFAASSASVVRPAQELLLSIIIRKDREILRSSR